MSMKIDTLLNLLPEGEHVYITGHVHPDGDCVGAALGLYDVLKRKHDVTVILEERPESYQDLSGFRHVMNYDEFFQMKKNILSTDYTLIVVDSGDLTRIEPIREMFEQAKVTVNIDHHDSNTEFADHNYVDTFASSTCEMVGLMLDLDSGNETYLNKELSECLYTGLIYDTGVFRHTNTRGLTHEIAARLVETGIDYNSMINAMYFTRSQKSVQAMNVATGNLSYENDGTIVMTTIHHTELGQYNLQKSDTESIISFLNEIEGPVASLFLLELKPGSFKGSFRSKSYMNVCNVAKVFGGGGHIKAAGCTIEGSGGEVKSRILKELELEFQRHH